LFRRLPVVGFSISKFLRTNVISRGTTTTTKREETTTRTKIITRTRRCRQQPPIHKRNIFFSFQGSFPATALLTNPATHANPLSSRATAATGIPPVCLFFLLLAGLLATAATYFSSSLLGEGEASLLGVTLRFDDLVSGGVIVNKFVFFVTTTSTTDGSFCDSSHLHRTDLQQMRG
jgi:hypothetical protein